MLRNFCILGCSTILLYSSTAKADGVGTLHNAMCGSYISTSEILKGGLSCQSNSLATQCEGKLSQSQRFDKNIYGSFTLSVNDYWTSVLNASFIVPINSNEDLEKIDYGKYINDLAKKYHEIYGSCETVAINPDMTGITLKCYGSKFVISAESVSAKKGGTVRKAVKVSCVSQ
jgi:hypothetical protein